MVEKREENNIITLYVTSIAGSHGEELLQLSITGKHNGVLTNDCWFCWADISVIHDIAHLGGVVVDSVFSIRI